MLKTLKTRKHFQNLPLLSIFPFQGQLSQNEFPNCQTSISSPVYDNFGLDCSCNTSTEYTWISSLPAEPRYLKETNNPKKPLQFSGTNLHRNSTFQKEREITYKVSLNEKQKSIFIGSFSAHNIKLPSILLDMSQRGGDMNQCLQQNTS